LSWRVIAFIADVVRKILLIYPTFFCAVWIDITISVTQVAGTAVMTITEVNWYSSTYALLNITSRLGNGD
tara:strand:+ start:3798 stop:4007 length:210 start_codon:yes stop_codon:yes gene_type:complete